MSPNKRYKDFVAQFLARGAVAVSIGLTTVGSSDSKVSPSSTDRRPARSFADRLSAIRSAVSEHVEEQRLQLAQAIPHPPPPPPPDHPAPPPDNPFSNFDNSHPFANFDNDPFHNFDNQHPFDNFGKAPFSNFDNGTTV